MGQLHSSRLAEGDLGAKLAAAQRRRRADAAQQRRDEPRPGALPPLGAAAYPGAPFVPHLAGPPLPPCDAERAAYVESLEVWGSPPAAELSNVLSICAGLMRSKTALIALFGDKKIWVKDAVGFQPGDFPWRASFCGWTLATAAPQALVVPNAHKDARFADHEFVKSGQIGFYAGTPLIGSNGHRLGTLCCADPAPREGLDESQCAILANFAAIVVRDLERGAAIRARAAELAAHSASGASAASSGGAAACARVLCVALAPGRGLMVVHASNETGELLTGAPGLDLVGRPLWSLLSAPAAARRDAEAAAAAGGPFALHGARLAGREAEADLAFRPISQAGAMPGPHVAVPSFVPDRPDGAAPDATFVVTIHLRTHAPAAAAAVQSGEGGWAPESLSSSSGASLSGPLPRAPRASDSGSLPPPRAPRRSDSGGGGGGSIQGLGGASVAVAEARARCPLPGLKIGAPLASGSYGRVFRGEYYGARVAVKVLEDGAVARRDPTTGVSLEAVLSRALHHPGIVATLTWRVVEGEARLPPPDSQLIGQSIPALPPARADADNAADNAAAAGPAALRGRLAAAGLADGRASNGPGCGIAPPPASDTGGSELGGGLSGPLGYCGPEGGSLSGPCLREEPQTWIVLEYCDKGCLQDAVDRGWLRTGRAPAAEEPDLLAVLATAREIAAAMAYLHAHDVIHGDLSAYNVLLSSASPSAPAAGRGFAAKVSDFGLARSLDHKSRVQTATYGTITHMAPEVLESGVVSKAADVYSFGVLLWQMCVGSRPWAGMPHAAVVRAVCVEGRSLQFGRETDEGVALLAAGCMARDPAERPSFQEVAEILADALAPLAAGAAGGAGA